MRVVDFRILSSVNFFPENPGKIRVIKIFKGKYLGSCSTSIPWFEVQN